MHRPLLVLTATLLMAAATHAQFEIQDSTTTADLRGVSAPGNGVAWASGTHGTVVRTEDGGYMWQGCAMPPGAEQLDFRGIQAFDDRTALVMSSGKGALSRIYKTTDGCQSWKLVFTNPDADGFFDAISLLGMTSGHVNNDSHVHGSVLGDPIRGHFAVFSTENGGSTWAGRVPLRRGRAGAKCQVDVFGSLEGEAAFAASNQSLISYPFLYSEGFLFVTGGAATRLGYVDHFDLDFSLCHDSAKYFSLPLLHGSPSSGAFAVAAKNDGDLFASPVMVVGGDYQNPDKSTGSSVFISAKKSWHIPLSPYFDIVAPQTPPHGYRSSVAYDAPTKTWITVGPNGADISTDDGRHWRPLRPMPGDAPGTDTGWNALALPWVVGPRGRIGKLHADALRLDTARADGR